MCLVALQAARVCVLRPHRSQLATLLLAPALRLKLVSWLATTFTASAVPSLWWVLGVATDTGDESEASFVSWASTHCFVSLNLKLSDLRKKPATKRTSNSDVVYGRPQFNEPPRTWFTPCLNMRRAVNLFSSSAAVEFGTSHSEWIRMGRCFLVQTAPPSPLRCWFQRRLRSPVMPTYQQSSSHSSTYKVIVSSSVLADRDVERVCRPWKLILSMAYDRPSK